MSNARAICDRARRSRAKTYRGSRATMHCARIAQSTSRDPHGGIPDTRREIFPQRARNTHGKRVASRARMLGRVGVAISCVVVASACGPHSGSSAACGPSSVVAEFAIAIPIAGSDGWFDPGTVDDNGVTDDGTNGGGGGDDTSGDDTGGDDGSGGDDSLTLPEPRVGKNLTLASRAVGLATHPAGCFGCTLSCVLANPPSDHPNAATADGTSNASHGEACGRAEDALRQYAASIGTTLSLCKVE
jgi:hypothetical protein